MSAYDTDKLFNAEAIRDTSGHNSIISFAGEFKPKTIIIENSLNQTVALQCQGSAHSDFSNAFNVGASVDVTATTDTYQTCDNFFPYFRMTATCSSSPTTGSLTVHLIKTRGA